MDRRREHVYNHGQEVLEKVLFNKYLAEERHKTAGAEKRVRDADLTFAILTAPEDCPVCFDEVAIDSANWRSGIGMVGEDQAAFENAVINLMQQELDHWKLGVNQAEADGGQTLVTRKRKGDGDVVCDLTCQWFNDPQQTRDFLNRGGNAALLGGPMFKITNLPIEGGSSCRTLCGVPVGVPSLISEPPLQSGE